MAKVRFGGGVASMSGRLGGDVFSRVRGTACVRRAPLRRPRQTAGLLDRQALLVWLGQQWAGLTDAGRAAWDTGARRTTSGVGLSTTGLTGRQFFIRSGVRASGLAGAWTVGSLGLVSGAMFRAPVSVVVWPGGPIEVTLASGTLTNNTRCLLRLQRPYRSSGGKPGRSWVTVSYQTVPGQVWSIPLATYGAIGSPAIGEQVYYEVVQWLPGLPGEYVSSGCTVVRNVGSEKIVNGGAELGAVGGLPTDWSVVTAGRLRKLASYAVADVYCADLETLAGEYQQMYPPLLTGGVTSGHTYEISFWYRWVSGANWSLDFLGNWTTHFWASSPTFTMDGAWRKVTQTLVAPASYATVRMEFKPAGVGACHRAYDGVTCREVLS